MNIVVCIKQVPDVDDIKWTKENNLDRSRMLSKINPYDEWTLNWALSIKAKFKAVNICVISMGPPQAAEVLSYALAKGADRAILLSDKAFGGSDTLITAQILARAIKKYVSDFSLILTGQLAPDGDTQQVPLSLAQELQVPDAVHITEIVNADKKTALVSQKVDKTTTMLEISTPCVLALKAQCPIEFTPKIDDYIRAQGTNIETYSAQDLDFDNKEVGVAGSPTMVYRAWRPETSKNTIEITCDYSKAILDFLLKVQ